MIVKLLTEHHLEFLSLTGGCRGSSESTHVKMPHCWKYHALAQILNSDVINLLFCLFEVVTDCRDLRRVSLISLVSKGLRFNYIIT